MTTEADILANAIDPALGMLPSPMTSDAARVALLIIGLEETDFSTRIQRPRKPGGMPGPARSYWQFERNTVAAVLIHPASRTQALKICAAREVVPTGRAVWQAMETDDLLGAAFARLLLYTDPHKLPTDAAGLWLYYLRVWRPGAYPQGSPAPSKWAPYFKRAVAAVNSQGTS